MLLAIGHANYWRTPAQLLEWEPRGLTLKWAFALADPAWTVGNPQREWAHAAPVTLVAVGGPGSEWATLVAPPALLASAPGTEWEASEGEAKWTGRIST